MQLILYWIVLFLFPWVFIWSFFWVTNWKYIKQYIVANILLALTYASFINYLSHNDLDGWGVVIFSFLALYCHFITGILAALFIKKKYLQRS